MILLRYVNLENNNDNNNKHLLCVKFYNQITDVFSYTKFSRI